MNVEHLGEVLSQHVTSASLNGSSSLWNECLASGSEVSSSEFLVLTLDSFDHWNAQQFSVCPLVTIQHLIYSFLGFYFCRVSGVSFLPKKLSGSYEGSWMFELPSDDVGPLVDQHRKVSVRLYPLGESGIHDGFTCWSDGHWLLQLSLSAVSHPGDFRLESFQVTFLFLEILLGDEHREVHIVHSSLFELFVQVILYLLPYEVRVLLEDVASRDVVVVNQIGFDYYLGVPLRKLLLFVCSYL